MNHPNLSQRVLVTGGAGYIGSCLVRLLLQQHYHVRVMDNLRFGGEPLIDLLNHERFQFIKGDVREENDLRQALPGINAIIHLASIVGDPACAKDPELARSTNLEGTKLLYRLAGEFGVSRFVFASTCSNYGKMADANGYVDEDSALSPVSLYAETKVASEQFLLTQAGKSCCAATCLRFSTVYGLSLRPRFDLTVNEFTKDLVLGRELVVFGEQFWRPYCHVVDLARSAIAVIEAEPGLVASQVFNVGDTRENYQKQMIVDEIRKQIPDAKVRYVARNEDPRDYRVSFEKIKRQLGFSITLRVPDGIREIIHCLRDGLIRTPDDPKYRNV